MSDKQVPVTFQPVGRKVFALPGAKVVEVAALAGLAIDTPCGGAGTCGKCRVQMIKGASEPAAMERKAFSKEELRAGWRLACQSTIRGEARVFVPERSLFGGQHQILTTSESEGVAAVQPAIRKVYVKLAAPTLADNVPDLLRLENAVGPFRTDIALLRELPKRLRDQQFTGTAVLSDHRLIDFERGDTTDQCLGIAFDIGTTTIVSSLLDLCNGKQLAVTSQMNAQVSFGDDVLSRIAHSSSCPECLGELQEAVLPQMRTMIQHLCTEAGVREEHVYEVSFAGNTTMEHLLCGVSADQLGQVPFVPAYARGLLIPAVEMGLPVNRRAMAYVFPVIGGFVGGDTAAGILATRLDSYSGPVLMVDIGTNGEIVLAHNGRMWAASTAAGPAFEGARISCGMRAARGAIEKVVIDDDVHCNVIGNVAAQGLCGSGLIDAVAELRRHGVVSENGRLLPPDALPDDVPEAVRERMRLDIDGSLQFRLAEAHGPAGETTVVALTQQDIREVQLACAAIRAGTSILLRRAGLQPHDLESLLVAGGFGSFIRRSNAQRIGLLPWELPHRRIRHVGNASLSGAQWALLSTEARRHAEQLARQICHVELSLDEDFQTEFAMAMFFPTEDAANEKTTQEETAR